MALSRPQKIVISALGVVVLIAGTIWAFRKSPPDSLASAFERHRQDFAGDYYVLLPLAAGTRLGHRVSDRELAESKSRRLTVDPNPCFFMPLPENLPSLSELVVKYGSQQSFSAELNNIVSGDVNEDGRATLVLRELRVANAIGVINPNGPCKDEGEHLIVTGEIVAGSAELTSERALSGKSATEAVPSTEGPGTAARSAWLQSSGYTVSAHDVVLGGRVQRVTVSRLTRRGTEDLRDGISLSQNPALGRRENLPDGIEGHIAIGTFSFTERWLELTVNVPLNAQARLPTGLEVCPVGKAERLALGRECYYMIGAGNVLLSVSWHLDAENNVRLVVYGYRTEHGQ